MKNILPYFLASLFLFSCKDEYTICDMPTEVRMKCGLYHNNNGIAAETAAPFLTVTNITSPDPDYASPMRSNFSLALNPILDSVKYIISVQQASTPDTVTFIYTTQKINVSATCGDIYINNLTKVSTTVHTLDSASISNSTITTASGENVRLYF